MPKQEVKSTPIVIHSPNMPSVPREDLVALSQAVVLVALSFLPAVNEKQQIALLALAAVLGTILSHSGAKRREARNSRIEGENLALIEAHTNLNLAAMGIVVEDSDG